MFICKICNKEYDENMRYSRDSRYCQKCGITYFRQILLQAKKEPFRR